MLDDDLYISDFKEQELNYVIIWPIFIQNAAKT